MHLNNTTGKEVQIQASLTSELHKMEMDGLQDKAEATEKEWFNITLFFVGLFLFASLLSQRSQKDKLAKLNGLLFKQTDRMKKVKKESAEKLKLMATCQVTLKEREHTLQLCIQKLQQGKMQSEEQQEILCQMEKYLEKLHQEMF